MIKTLSDFLTELKSKETELIKKYEIVNHPVLIGDMYEGLTQEIISRVIFDGFDLKIVGGKIKNSKGELSSEIDCMLVEGIGEKLPYTDKFIYHFSQVIAVIEVKKSLYSNTLEDSYTNLKTVIDVSREPEKDGTNYMMRSLRDSWKSMLRMELPKRADLHLYTESEQYIYHTLLMEAYLPIRIVFGYFGFKTEFSLREAFAKYLGDKANSQPARVFGVGSLPSLIICGKNSIIKNNGMPFGAPFMDEEYYWPILATTRENPIYNLIEIIWTRLSYKFNISSQIFGDDFEFHNVHRFINCKWTKIDSVNSGWSYFYSPYTENALSQEKNEKIKWSPNFLNSIQFNIIKQLGMFEYINLKENSNFTKFIEEQGEDVNLVIQSLIDTGLVYKRNNEIRLLTDECATAILPDGRLCAGENKNGEFVHWLNNYLDGNEPTADSI